jgi:MFS family permease
MVGIYVFLILAGISKGATMVPLAAIRGRYFGRKSFGSIRGISMLLMTPFGIVAPVYGGWVYDTTGSYTIVLTLCAALLAFATVIMVFALPPKPPAQVTDARKIV